MGFSSLIANRSSKTYVLVAIGFALILNGALSSAAGVHETSKVHIVYLGARQLEDPRLVTASHHRILESVFGSKDAARKSMIYSYRHGFSGFAAKLNASQVKTLSGHPGVVHIVPNRILQLKTTRAFDYLGLLPGAPKGLLHDTNMGSEAIIGVLDSGIWPEAESFNDKGIGPVPARWKGECISGEGFDAKIHCNRKLIGAKYFLEGVLQENNGTFNFSQYSDFKSNRDGGGHGTHVASTAAGSFVPGVSMAGLAGGTARGGAPRARVASYKVCWNGAGCSGSDMVKAIDHAIRDGVDVISISIGNVIPNDFEVDQKDIGIASFHAVMNGIPVVCAAGNEGPGPQTVDNVAPWIITVAASTMDRAFPVSITLGNNLTMMAQGIYAGQEVGFVDLIYGGELRGADIRGGLLKDKVVLLFTSNEMDKERVNIIRENGCAGLIVAQSVVDPIQCNGEFPCVSVDYELGTDILYYIQTKASPKIKISPSKTVIGQPIATKIPLFSCRGPNSISPAILKPDIAAPGVNILGALPGSGPREFGFMTGTSMATPAVSGIVGLLRAKHRNWSPAAIRSALVTTAWRTDPFGVPIMSEGASPKRADPFDYGGGIMNPDKAAHPGLVYDMGFDDYVHYLCSAGYEDKDISTLLGKAYTCPTPKPSILDVNLPSITIPDLNEELTITRTVTNVGPVDSVYKPVMEAPLGINLEVNPQTLAFNSATKKLAFKVKVSTTYKVNTDFYFGSLTWTDGTHNVTIPLSVRTKIWKYSV